MGDRHTITYPLFVFAGGADDDMGEFEVEFTGDIVPYRRATGPNWDSGGEPSEGGYAELTGASMAQTQPFKVYAADETTNMSWLLETLPKATLDDISTLIYDDWTQDDRRTA